jgi:hypothetical protein
MIKRMILTGLIITFTAICLYSQGVEKTGGLARLAGIGGNPYVMDPFFNTVNPAWNSVYDNFVLGDLGSSAGAPFSAGGFGQYLSGSFRIGRNFTLGGILARNDFNGMSVALLDPGSNNSLGIPIGGVVSTVNGIRGTGAVIPLDNNFEIIGTYSMGNLALGLGIAYASTTNDFTPATGTSSEGAASQLGFNLGLLTDITSSIKLDLGASFIMPSASFKLSTDNETAASQTIIMVNGRAFWDISSKLQFVPVVLFATASGTLDSGVTSTGSIDMPSFSSIGVGAGLNYRVGDFLLAGGVIFSTNSLTFPAIQNVNPELSNSATIFPLWNFGVEWDLLDWLVGRFGYVSFTGSVTNETAPTATSVDEAVFTFFTPSQRGATVGVGFRFGDFSLDATVNEDVLRQGFNNIGGGGASFAYLTASYAMP